MLIKTRREVDVLCVVTRRPPVERGRTKKLRTSVLNVKCFCARVAVLNYIIHALATDALPCLNMYFFWFGFFRVIVVELCYFRRRKLERVANCARLRCRSTSHTLRKRPTRDTHTAHQELGSEAEARYTVDERESLWSLPFEATTSAGKFPLHILSC